MSDVADVSLLTATGDAMENPNDYCVERITMQRSLRRPAQPYLRVTRSGD
jgi:hypothetical protein